MLEALGTAAGGLAGSALGGISDVLSAPRRALWGGVSSLLGTETPESGSDLLGRLGMDRDSPLTDILGFGVETLSDPLTYAGGLLGRLGGRAASTLAGRGATAADSAASPLLSTLKGGERLDRMAGGGLEFAMRPGARPQALAGAGAGKYMPPGRSVPIESISMDPDMLRMSQLNAPSFVPDMPAYNLGTSAFSQAAPAENTLLSRLARMAV